MIKLIFSWSYFSEKSKFSITPWHHDRPYYFIDGPKNFSIWITPDDIDEENSLAFCAGSHKSDNIYIPVNFDDVSDLANEPTLKELDKVALAKEAENGILIFKMSPGDAIFFHNRTLHRSLPSSQKIKEQHYLLECWVMMHV